MRLTVLSISALVGSTQAFYLKDRESVEHHLESQTALLLGNAFNPGNLNLGDMSDASSEGGNSIMDLMKTTSYSSSDKPTMYANFEDHDDSTPVETGYGSPEKGMGALDNYNKQQQAKKEEKDIKQQKGRSTSSNSAPSIITPSQAITDAKADNVMILSSDYMYVSNCLLRNKHINDPVRQNGFELFKQTAAGEWFVVFGYVCGLDYKCWKKNVQNLLSKKGESYGGNMVGRCISRLVREKAEGNRMRKRKRRSLKSSTKSSTNELTALI